MYFFPGNLKYLRTVFDLKGPSLAEQIEELKKKAHHEDAIPTKKTINNWESGFSRPSNIDLWALRQIFHITADMLLYSDLSKIPAENLKDCIKAVYDTHNAKEKECSKKKKGAK